MCFQKMTLWGGNPHRVCQRGKIVLLQSGKAESANIIQGGGSELFQNRKERGAELFISRLTLFLGLCFFGISLALFLM